MSNAQIPVGFIVSLETRNFSFEAHGLTEEQATETMKRTLQMHGRQCGLPDDWSDLYADSFQTRQFLPSVGFRDNERLF